jgi:hypothetical protein
MPTIGVRTVPLLKSRHKDLPIHTPSDLHRFGSCNFLAHALDW